VIKQPGVYIRYAWIWTGLELATAAGLLVVLVKYRTYVEGLVQAAIQSVLKH